MSRHRKIVAAVLLLGLLGGSSAFASGRDSDGSRMQARPHEPGERAQDQLSPPSDNVDWRYFRLSEASDVTIEVDANPGSAAVKVTITDAMGKSITSVVTSDGKVTTRRRLDPGLYYVAVSCTTSVAYTLSIR